MSESPVNLRNLRILWLSKEVRVLEAALASSQNIQLHLAVALEQACISAPETYAIATQAETAARLANARLMLRNHTPESLNHPV